MSGSALKRGRSSVPTRELGTGACLVRSGMGARGRCTAEWSQSLTVLLLLLLLVWSRYSSARSQLPVSRSSAELGRSRSSWWSDTPLQPAHRGEPTTALWQPKKGSELIRSSSSRRRADSCPRALLRPLSPLLPARLSPLPAMHGPPRPPPAPTPDCTCPAAVRAAVRPVHPSQVRHALGSALARARRERCAGPEGVCEGEEGGDDQSGRDRRVWYVRPHLFGLSFGLLVLIKWWWRVIVRSEHGTRVGGP